MSDEVFLVIIGGVSTFLTTWILQNKALREGITSSLLKKLNKESIKKIPLKDHKVFTYLKSTNTGLNFLVFKSNTKSVFYQTFIQLLFTELNKFCLDIISSKESSTSFDNFVINKLDEHIVNFKNEFNSTLVTPVKVSKQLLQWKVMLLESLKRTMENLLSDELVDSNYFKIYRILDLVSGFTNIALSTGAVTFNQMNGAFDELTVEDIFIKKDS